MSVAEAVPAINTVVLVGRLSRPAEHRALPSGDDLVSLEVSVARPGQRAETVPVVWFGAPASSSMLDVDEHVAVVGRVRRRFFRSGGATQSRTEVVAEAVVPLHRGRRARTVLTGAVCRLQDTLDLAASAGAQVPKARSRGTKLARNADQSDQKGSHSGHPPDPG